MNFDKAEDAKAAVSKLHEQTYAVTSRRPRTKSLRRMMRRIPSMSNVRRVRLIANASISRNLQQGMVRKVVLHAASARTKARTNIDFSSTGGPKNLDGEYANGTIIFADKNKWTRMVDQSCSKIMAGQILSPTSGVYRDVNCSNCGKDSWEKVRFVSDMLGDATEDQLCIIGSDDSSDFGFATGDVDRTAGTVRVDLSLVDGPIVDASWKAEGISGEGLEWKHLVEPCCGTPTVAHV